LYPIIKPDEIKVEVSRGSIDQLPFYCVSPIQFSVLSILTFGLFELFWFYKNWVLVKSRTASNIRPFWRAFFSPIFCYPFANAVKSAAESANLAPRISPGTIATVYVGLLILQELPDPYWLISIFSFVPLVPVVWRIGDVHEAIRPGFDSRVGWTGPYIVALIVGGIFFSLVILGSSGPSTRALRDAEIPPSYGESLEEAGILEPGERIQFFYSAGLFSILEDGNLLTDTRVVSYETLDGELYVASSLYSEVGKFDVVYSDNYFADTVITIMPSTGDEFFLIVSSEEGRDKDFVSALQGYVSQYQ
jgi:hypothetical protein